MLNLSGGALFLRFSATSAAKKAEELLRKAQNIAEGEVRS